MLSQKSSLKEWAERDKELQEQWWDCYERLDIDGCERALLSTTANTAERFGSAKPDTDGVAVFWHERKVG